NSASPGNGQINTERQKHSDEKTKPEVAQLLRQLFLGIGSRIEVLISGLFGDQPRDFSQTETTRAAEFLFHWGLRSAIRTMHRTPPQTDDFYYRDSSFSSKRVVVCSVTLAPISAFGSDTIFAVSCACGRRCC